jgi:hypothetical protein
MDAKNQKLLSFTVQFPGVESPNMLLSGLSTLSIRHMAQHTALHIQSRSREAVMHFLQEYLTYACRPQVVRRIKTHSFSNSHATNFLGSQEPQWMFAVTFDQPGWITAHYNSCEPLCDLAAALSHRFDCVVVLVIVQSVIGAFYIGVYQAGVHLRKLHFEEGDWVRQEGSPLPFEPYLEATDRGEEKEFPHREFNRVAVVDYCTRLGLLLWTYSEELVD